MTKKICHYTHCETTLGSRGNLVKHEITTPHEMRLVMTEALKARQIKRATLYLYQGSVALVTPHPMPYSLGIRHKKRPLNLTRVKGP
jgi:hypothetical protein